MLCSFIIFAAYSVLKPSVHQKFFKELIADSIFVFTIDRLMSFRSNVRASVISGFKASHKNCTMWADSYVFSFLTWPLADCPQPNITLSLPDSTAISKSVIIAE